MAVTLHASGTQTAVIATEHAVSTSTTSGTFTFHVDCVNMIDGDILELRVKQIILTGGTKRVQAIGFFYGAQLIDDLIKISIPISNDLTDASSLEFTLKQTFGTGRAYPWKVIKHN